MANVDLNLFSAYRATQAVLPGMVERKWGRIINIGSGYARHSGGDFAYTAAKHGLVGLTRAMAAKVALEGVCINCLCPTWTHTQLINYDNWTEEERRERTAANLQKPILQPEELGPMAVLLASEEGSSMTGLEEAQHYWLSYHGPVLRNSVSGSASIMRYFQVHRFDHELADQLREARGTQAEPYTGVAELWRARPGKSDPTSEGADADRIIKADERKFIDLERSAIQFTKERVFIDHVLCEI